MPGKHAFTCCVSDIEMGGRSGHHNNLQKIGLDHSSTVSFLSDMFLDVEKKLCHNQYCIVVITIIEDKGQIHTEFQFTKAPFIPDSAFCYWCLHYFAIGTAHQKAKIIPLRINKLPLLIEMC